MEHNNTLDWKAIASEEHEQRKKVELEMETTLESLHAAREALKTTTSYNKLLESRFHDAEAKAASNASRLHQVIEMLKKAQALLAKRKQELSFLRNENKKLQLALQSKTELLQAEMLLHEQAKQKLTMLQITANKPSAKVATVTAVHPNEQLEQYFAHKVLGVTQAQEHQDTLLQEDTDFMAQLLYIDQQFKQNVTQA